MGISISIQKNRCRSWNIADDPFIEARIYFDKRQILGMRNKSPDAGMFDATQAVRRPVRTLIFMAGMPYIL